MCVCCFHWDLDWAGLSWLPLLVGGLVVRLVGLLDCVCSVGCSVGWSVDGLVLFDRFVGGLVGWLHGRLVS